MSVSRELNDLCDYLIVKGKNNKANKLFSLAIALESVGINLLELESLINSDKFEFEKPEIGLVGIENEKLN